MIKTITIYGIKNCDTMKKARAWLDGHGVKYDFHDYKSEGIGKDMLKAWCEELGWETLLNRAKNRAKEPEGVKAWRSRMDSAAGQDVYRRRKLIERVNGHLKNHGFGFLPVRGLIKARAVALWHALANNLMAAHRLRAQAA